MKNEQILLFKIFIWGFFLIHKKQQTHQMGKYTAADLLRMAKQEQNGSKNQQNFLMCAMATQADEDYDAESEDRVKKGLSPLKTRQESFSIFETKQVHHKKGITLLLPFCCCWHQN
jgi:hypothetical protein